MGGALRSTETVQASNDPSMGKAKSQLLVSPVVKEGWDYGKSWKERKKRETKSESECRVARVIALFLQASRTRYDNRKGIQVARLS